MSDISGHPFRDELPPVEWFAVGTIEQRKFDEYLLSPRHPDGREKLRLWRSIFGFGEEDGGLLERSIREQLPQAKVVEREPAVDLNDPERTYRRWRLDIPHFRGPNNVVGPVRTQWALVPENNSPHLTTAYPLLD